jgi:pyruvate formate lyase activating enzyme
VVLSGGEPTINPEVFDLCQRIKKMGYQIKLDTNGVNPEMVRSLIRQRLIDYVAMDIKSPKEKYMETIGLKTKIGELGETRLKFWSDNIIRNIEKTIKILKKGDLDFEFRTTFVPGFLKKKDVLKIAQWIGPAPKYFLQEFKPGKTLEAGFGDRKAKKTQELVDILRSIRPFFDVCELRTR